MKHVLQYVNGHAANNGGAYNVKLIRASSQSQRRFYIFALNKTFLIPKKTWKKTDSYDLASIILGWWQLNLDHLFNTSTSVDEQRKTNATDIISFKSNVHNYHDINKQMIIETLINKNNVYIIYNDSLIVCESTMGSSWDTICGLFVVEICPYSLMHTSMLVSVIMH